MIDIDNHALPGVVTVRQFGDQSCLDILDAAARLSLMGPGARVIFDWRDVGVWPCLPVDDRTMEVCFHAGAAVAAAAIVHARRLGRQAAWLAATLRMNRVQVRCFRASDAEAALAWLRR